MAPRKMKETMRKKPAKAESTNDAVVGNDVVVVSPTSDTESVATNPWVDVPSVPYDIPPLPNVNGNGEPTSPKAPKSKKPRDQSQVSKVSRESEVSDPAQPDKESGETTPKDTQPSATLKPPEPPPDDPQATTLRTTKRRKTVTKTPHTFELAEDLKPTKPKEETPAPVEEPTPELPSTPNKLVKRKSKPAEPPPPPPAPTLTFSKVTTTYDLKPIKAKVPKPPKSPPPQPALAPAPAPVRTPSIAPNPFTAAHRPRQSLSAQLPAPSNPTRFTPPTLSSGPQDDYDDFFFGKVVVITHGASPIGSSIVKFLHAFGARVILGDPDPVAAKEVIKSLGEPHLVHFNKCDTRRYGDMLGLFKLAVTMYGRVDHAIFGVGEDGGSAAEVGEGEKGWLHHAMMKGSVEAVEREPPGLVDTIGASVRFAHIALAYLRHTPKKKTKKKGRPPGLDQNDRSLTLMTSVAAFKEMPGLPIYQVAQHGVLGLMRSLRLSVDPDKDGVRINVVVTNMMVARAHAAADGRMSVKLPLGAEEDVGRTVVGVVAAGAAEGGSGIWYERGSEKGMSEKKLHGRAIYVIGGECWDMEEGLSRAEPAWLGATPSETLAKAQEGIGRGSQWILDIA